MPGYAWKRWARLLRLFQSRDNSVSENTSIGTSTRLALLQTTDYALIDGGSPVLQPSSENVGIGTTAPDQKLTVNGTVHAKVVLAL